MSAQIAQIALSPSAVRRAWSARRFQAPVHSHMCINELVAQPGPTSRAAKRPGAANLAPAGLPAARHRSRSENHEKWHRCRGDAGSTGPSALPASITVIRRASAQPAAFSCHVQRWKSGAVATDKKEIACLRADRRSASLRRFWRHCRRCSTHAQPAGGVMASHRALYAPFSRHGALKTTPTPSAWALWPFFRALPGRRPARPGLAVTRGRLLHSNFL